MGTFSRTTAGLTGGESQPHPEQSTYSRLTPVKSFPSTRLLEVQIKLKLWSAKLWIRKDSVDRQIDVGCLGAFHH